MEGVNITNQYMLFCIYIYNRLSIRRLFILMIREQLLE